MTTDAPRTRTTTSGLLLVGAAVSTMVLTGALAISAGLTADAAAVRGAIVGGAVALLFFVLGTVSVNAVATVMPAASLIVALMTYVLQVVLIAAVFLGLQRGGAFDSALDEQWVAAGVILGTFAWMVAQVIFTMKARIPVYDLPAETSAATKSEPREVGAE